jgi:transcriptional regulator with XRE-family HTH domain
LAERARLHRTEIGKIEQGNVEPRLTTLVILADALGVTLDEMVAGLDVPKHRRSTAIPSERQGLSQAVKQCLNQSADMAFPTQDVQPIDLASRARNAACAPHGESRDRELT